MALVKHTYRLANGEQKTSNDWYYRFIHEGKVYFGSTKTSNKKLAEKIERKKYEKILARAELGEKETITVKDGLLSFLKTQEKNGEHRNIKTYVHKMLGTKTSKQFDKKCGKHVDVTIEVHGFDTEKEFHELSDADVQRLILARRTEGNADATILLELIQLSKAISIVGKLGYAAPTIKFKELKKDNQLKPSKKKLRYLSPDEESRLMVELDPATAKNWELKEERTEIRDFVVVLLDTGARYSEIATLMWADVNLEARTINLYRSKVDNESVLYMTDRAYEVLKRRHESKRKDQIYVFEDSTKTTHRKYAPKAFNNACKRAKIANCTLKTCRKTNASRLVQAGVPLLDVSKLLGHASVTTTATYYAHLAPSHASKGAIAVLNRIEGERKDDEAKREAE
jgi:integrase